MNLNVSFGTKSGRVGGGRPVFDQRFRQSRVADGAMILNAPAKGGMIFTGDIAEFDESTHVCKHLKVFELAADITDASTEILFKRGDFYHKLEAGLVIFPAPSSLSALNPSIVVGTVTEKVNETAGDVYSMAVVAGSLGAGVSYDKGTLFVEAVNLGTILTYSVSTAGTGYVAGDILTAVQTGSTSPATFEVLTVNGDTGAIETVKQLALGAGYKVGAGLATTTDSTAGTGAKITITVVGSQMLIQNPNTCFTHDVYIDETPTTASDWSGGFKYAAALFNSATIIECMATKVPSAVKGNLRTGYSDIRILNYI